jgi:PhnB protein
VAKVKPIPEGMHTVVSYLTLNNAGEAIDFYKKAFGAEEVVRMTGPGGHGVMHAELKIGDSLLFLADEFPGMGNPSPKTLGGTTVGIHLNVADVDAVFARAVAAGARAEMPPADMFWGDRFGKLTDPFGHSWSLSTHIEDVSHEEMARRSEAFFAEMAKQKAQSGA